MRRLMLMGLLLAAAGSANAADLKCQAFIDGRGYSSANVLVLTPMAQNNTMLMVKKDSYSFVVDTLEFAKNGSLRLFIHDIKEDHTAVSDGLMKKIGSEHEAHLEQIIGYDSKDPMTLSLSCFN